MTVVVTGASGHIGNNLVRELLRCGCKVRALIHNNERSLEGLDIERVHGDVRDILQLFNSFRFFPSGMPVSSERAPRQP